MRVVLDTNILVSALVSTTGTPSRLVDAWIAGEFVLVSHALQVEELRGVTRRDKIRRLIRRADAGRLVNQISAVAEMPKALPALESSPDPSDELRRRMQAPSGGRPCRRNLLALREAGRANWLVTGDKTDLLALGRHGATRIATAAAMAEALGPG